MKDKSKNYMIWLIAGLVVLLFFLYRYNVNFGQTEKKQITIITKSKYGENWEAISAGIRAGANEFGVDVKMLAPDSDKDVSAQKGLLETAAAGGTDAIILAPIDFSALEEIVDSIKAQGIPVFIIVSLNDKYPPDYYVGLDHYDIGKKLGESIVNQIGNEGYVALMSIVELTDDNVLKEKGIMDYLKQFPSIKVLTAKDKPLGEFSITMQTIDLIRKKEEVDILVGLDEGATRGIIRAFDNVKSNVKVVGFGSSDEVLNNVELEVINELVVPNYFGIGYIAIKNTVAYLSHNKFNETTYIDSIKINSKNIHNEENQKIIFPIK